MSKCWYCNEELTTANYCDEHIGICTKCYASMFQVSNEFVKGLMDKIADLEAKLAESEKQNKRLYNENESAERILRMSSDEQTREIKRLQNELSSKVDYIHELVEVKDDYKQQLAEKEEEIKQLNNRILFSQLQAPEEQKLKIIGSSCCQYNPKRDKISFALEQLEKVKELVEEKSMTQSPFGTQKIYASNVSEIIDNQIEELKKEIK